MSILQGNILILCLQRTSANPMLCSRQWIKHRYVWLWRSVCWFCRWWWLWKWNDLGFLDLNGARSATNHGFDASSNGSSGQNDSNSDDGLAPEVWVLTQALTILMAKQQIFSLSPSKASIMFLVTFYCSFNSAITCLTEDFNTWIWLHAFCIVNNCCSR